MRGTRRTYRHWVREALCGVALVLILSGCASTQRNPFGQTEGPIYLTLVNSGGRPVSARLLGLGDAIGLGVFLGGETRFLEFLVEGQGDISVQLSRLNGGEVYETFRARAEPGDRFLLQIENDLRLARLIRTREP
jgi:hypothetical protein